MEIIHNIWHKQSEKRNAYMYATTLNDYLKAFKQIALYYVFWHGGHSKIRPNSDELWLCMVSQFGDSL
jgi:hypothetical protein